MNEHLSNNRDFVLRKPAPEEKETICREWGTAIRRETKRIKRKAEVHVCVVALLLLVLILQMPHNVYLLAAAGVVLVIYTLREFSKLASAAGKLKRRQANLEQGRFLVAETTGTRLRKTKGPNPRLCVELVSGAVYRSVRPWKQGEKEESCRQFPVLLVQLEGEPEAMAFSMGKACRD